MQFSSQLNAVGAFSGKLRLGSQAVRKLDPITATEPDRIALYVDRDGVLMWGGLLLTRLWDSSSRELTLGALDFTHWLQRRHLYTTISAAPQDQLLIVQNIVNYLQSLPGGNIGIVVPAAASAINRTVLYSPWDLKLAYDAVRELSQLYAGFDYAIDVSYDQTGIPQKVLTLSYPRRGANVAKTGWLFELPGNITNYKYPEDGTSHANQIYAAGAGSGPNKLISSAADTSQLTAYPLLEDVLSYTAITDKGMLDATVQAALPARRKPVTIPELTVRADKDPVLGSYIVGDDARVRITDLRFPAPAAGGAGLDTYLRIVGWTVTPPARGNPEGVTLLTGAPS